MPAPTRTFLLSPANLKGQRGGLLLNPSSQLPLARELRSARGAELGEVFSFVSSLYFRGKLAYARAFGHSGDQPKGAYVIAAGGGLCEPEERISFERLQSWAKVAIHRDNPHYTAPLIRQASALLDSAAPGAEFVLLGSVASDKYVQPLLDVFGAALSFPKRFAGLGDMSRGALLLRAVREHSELEYVPVTARRGPKAP